MSSAARRSRSAASRGMLGRQFVEAQLERGGEADDAGHVERAAAAAFLLAAAGDLRLEPHDRIAPADVQRADAFGAVDLVGGETHQVDAERRDVDGDLADGLRRVAVQQDAALFADARRSRRAAG